MQGQGTRRPLGFTTSSAATGIPAARPSTGCGHRSRRSIQLRSPRRGGPAGGAGHPGGRDRADHSLDHAAGSQPEELRLVGVAHHRPRQHPTQQQDRPMERRDGAPTGRRIPEASCRPPPGSARSARPRSRRRAGRVVQDAASQRRSERVGLCATVRATSSSRLAKSPGPSMKSVMWRAFSGVSPGVTSIRPSRGRPAVLAPRRARATRPPSDMPTTAARGRCRAHRAARRRRVRAPDVARAAGGRSEWPWPGRSIARRGRPSARATVSNVWAFCAPPCSRTSWGAARPQRSALRRRPGRDGCVEALAPRGARVGEATTPRRSRGTYENSS